MLLDKDNTTSNYRANKPAQLKLKIRAAMRSQGKNLLKALTNPPDTAKSFVLHPTWARVFLPTLMYLSLASQHPFQDFVNNSPAFLAIAQEALNATHPNISHTVIAGNAIVTMVSFACILGTHGLKYYPSLSGIQLTQVQAFSDSLRGSQTHQEVFQSRHFH